MTSGTRLDDEGGTEHCGSNKKSSSSNNGVRRDDGGYNEMGGIEKINRNTRSCSNDNNNKCTSSNVTNDGDGNVK